MTKNLKLVECIKKSELEEFHVFYTLIIAFIIYFLPFYSKEKNLYEFYKPRTFKTLIFAIQKDFKLFVATAFIKQFFWLIIISI